MSDILFEEVSGNEGDLGLITLNRPKALNALTYQMILALEEKLHTWEQQKNIKAVVIRATEGRAFCAGGDIREMYERKLAKDPLMGDFFTKEYEMNKHIHNYTKPYIALLDGITMGGGVGVSIHGSYRIGTENLLFAMPETGIGFYPDVGTTYYLPRLPHKTGYYLGLTGARISYADCYAIGLIEEVIARESIPKIIPALAEAAIPNKSAVSDILQSFAIKPPGSELLQHKDEIEACFAKPSVEEILHALENYSSEWCQQTAYILRTKSPTSLKVTLHALHGAEKLNFDNCMKIENRLTFHFIQEHDFFEGVRAVIIDKDHQPQWKPANLADVTSQKVADYFMPLEKELV